MKKIFMRRPSPAMIVAVTALCVSVVGTAAAGPLAEISALNKKDKQQIRKIATRIANKMISKRAPGLSVASAQTAVSATTAVTANTAKTADTAKTANTANTANTAQTANTVPDGSITTAKLANSAVTQAKVATNAIGAAQLKNLITRTANVELANGGSNFAVAECLGSEQVLSGGTGWGGDGNDRYTNYVKIIGNSVYARGNNFTGGNQTFFSEAFCLPG